MRAMIHKARKQPKASSSPRASNLRSCAALPILLGNESKIGAAASEMHLHLNGVEIADHAKFPRLQEYIEEFYRLRQRKGVTRIEAARLILNPTTFASVSSTMRTSFSAVSS